MSNASGIPRIIIILFDPRDRHITLDADRYSFFRRFTDFVQARQLIATNRYELVNLHVPIDFNFNDMLEHPEVYIHTYFMDDEETSYLNNMERQKIRESIQDFCSKTGEEYTEHGVMDSNLSAFDAGMELAVLLHQMGLARQDRLLQ